MNKILILLCCLAFGSIRAQELHVQTTHTFSRINAGALEPHQTVIAHAYYTIGYFEKYRIPLWTFYSCNRDTMLKCLLPRKGSFRSDPLCPLKQAGKQDYAMPFEKGHLVPCEPMTFDETAMKETFYYTNCVPQYEKVNSGRWKTLEKLVNNWAMDHTEVLVFTGNIVSDSSLYLGADSIAVPDYCYKIVLDYQLPEIKAIAFLVPNKDRKLLALENYVTTIDHLESLTGMDFFNDLPLEEQEKFESASTVSEWDWKPGKYDARFKQLKKDKGVWK